MRSESEETGQFIRRLASLAQASWSGARVEVADQEFGSDVVHITIALDQREPVSSTAVRERTGTYGARVSRPLNLLVSREALRAMVKNPGRMERAFDQMREWASKQPGMVSFWLVTTVGLERVDVGSGIVGLSDAFTDDLADRVAIEEGRREFTTWLSRNPLNDEDVNNA